MEETGECAQKSLVTELTQGRELAMQLQAYLNIPSSSSSNEICEWLVRQIQASYDNALSMLKLNHNNSSTPHSALAIGVSVTAESQPLSRTGSPRNGDPDRRFKEQGDELRKTLSRWTKQVRVRPAGTSLDGPLDDGFCWRKYGQKDILGAKYPRCYFRCAHRNSQGCLTTKLVQRSDDDPTLFEITYRGRHTCNLSCNVVLTRAPAETNIVTQQQEENRTQQSLDLLVPGPDSEIGDHRIYPSSTFDTETAKFSHMLSPNQSGMNNSNTIVAPDVESRVTEIIQVAGGSTSEANAPGGGLNFPFGKDGLDPNSTPDNRGFFS